MPNIMDHQSSKTTKLLFIGDSGAGKSGALASLAQAGFNLRILDLDNGIDVLKNLVNPKTGNYGPEAYKHISFETITDPMKNVNGKLIPKSATVWQRAIKLLDNWKTPTDDFGPVSTWTDQEVLVIDSLTFLSNAAMNFVLAMNARLGQQAHQSDWYSGQQLVEGLLQTLYDVGIKCNVIVIAHITYIGEENGPVRGYPNTLGKALPPKVGRYFNTILMARSGGSGQNVKREILTNTSGVVELKNTSPTKVQPKYPLESGLADYFKAIRGGD